MSDINTNFINPLYKSNKKFSIVAIRCNSAPDAMRKGIEDGKIYYFLNGYTIDVDSISEELWRVQQDSLFDDYCCDGYNDAPHIQFSAIVGENGSGKSSLVELMMRMINNLAVSLFIKEPQTESPENLLYISGISGDLWCKIEDTICQLSVRDESVRISSWSKDENFENTYRSVTVIYDNACNRKIDERHNLQSSSTVSKVASSFFYTIASNYSIYAYNTKEYIHECDPQVTGDIFGTAFAYQKFNVEHRCWLHSYFHKNDGYRLPLLLTPFRSEGNIDINSETELARERLIALLIKQENLHCINDHLKAKSISLSISHQFDYSWMKGNLRMQNLTEEGYSLLRESVLNGWESVLRIKLMENDRGARSVALNYLVYKTLKISKQYKIYEEFYRKHRLMTDSFSHEMLIDLIEREARDFSHVTRKLFQTLAHIIYEVYCLNSGDVGEMPLASLAQRWHTRALKPNGIELDLLGNHIQVNAIFPPPFFDVDVKFSLSHKEDTTIMLSGLSSGERQQVYSMTSILYHIDNINSVFEDKNNIRVKYRNINIVLEEVELYYHPELQRKFIKYLLDSIKQMSLRNLNGIHFIVITHSPYILSDIPRTNVLALRKEKHEKVVLKTFGANIHEMLKDSFFLSKGAIGAFAMWEITHILRCIDVHNLALDNQIQAIKQMKKTDGFDFLNRYYEFGGEFVYSEFEKDMSLDLLSKWADLIDESIIKNVLMSKLNEVICKKYQKLRKVEKIAELKRQLKELEEE